MMMRCSKAEHDKLFPKNQNEHQEIENLDDLSETPSGVSESLGGIVLGRKSTSGGFTLISKGLQRSLDEVRRIYVEAHSHTCDSTELDSRVRCRYVHSTGYWRRIR